MARKKIKTGEEKDLKNLHIEFNDATPAELEEIEREEFEQESEIEDELTLDASNDSLSMYYKEMAMYKLLTPEEEKEITKKVKEGDPEAKQRLIECNLRLAANIARHYQGRGLALEDLVQEANMGLMKAADKYDYEKGFRFSTYATWWIRQAITRAIADTGRAVRLPVHVNEKLSQLKVATAKLMDKLGRLPTDEELAEACNITITQLHVLKKNEMSIASLDTKVGEEEDCSLGDFVIDDKAPSPEQEAIAKNLREIIDTLMGDLTEREQFILSKRFGLDGSPPMTLEEVGNTLGVTRERVRQVEMKALRKLKHPKRIKLLKDFL